MSKTITKKDINESFEEFLPRVLDIMNDPEILIKKIESAKILSLDGSNRRVTFKFKKKFITIQIEKFGTHIFYPPRADRNNMFGHKFVKWGDPIGKTG